MTKNFTDFSDDDRAAIKAILEGELAAGVEEPKLPIEPDVDGDGVVDVWTLDETGELIIVRDVDLEETLYESEGDDITDKADSEEESADSGE